MEHLSDTHTLLLNKFNVVPILFSHASQLAMLLQLMFKINVLAKRIFLYLICLRRHSLSVTGFLVHIDDWCIVPEPALICLGALSLARGDAGLPAANEAAEQRRPGSRVASPAGEDGPTEQAAPLDSAC